MAWYVEQRRVLEEQVKKYSDPPSEHLLPDLPNHARCPLPGYIVFETSMLWMQNCRQVALTECAATA